MPRRHNNNDQPLPATAACQRLEDQLHYEWAARRASHEATREAARIEQFAQKFREQAGR